MARLGHRTVGTGTARLSPLMEAAGERWPGGSGPISALQMLIFQQLASSGASVINHEKIRLAARPLAPIAATDSWARGAAGLAQGESIIFLN